MPVVFRHDGHRFFFYSDEGNPREPIHIHVRKDDREAKFWLFPDVRLAYNDGYDSRTLNELRGLAAFGRNRIEKAWHEHFGT